MIKTFKVSKLIADAGICSRRKAELLIREGRVKLNNKILTSIPERATVKDLIKVDNKKIDFKNSVSKTFDNYYKFDDYLFIKNIVKNQRGMSVGLDPMIAVMNDIKVIDGYHTLYPLSYKFKFRKIIEKELEKNTVLKNYYDSWGSRVYAFYNNQNNIMLNFQAAKKIGADYVISKFPIENNELEKVCSECNGSNEIFLYKIL